jgi:hypothetical protein
MIKILKPIKDAYVNNRNIDNIAVTDSNTGKASTLDLFKITSSGSIELSRALLKFDYSDIQNKFLSGTVDINSDSFKCKLKLFNVSGGQSLPANFNLRIMPLSKSFDEGLGRDVIKYADVDVVNFLTASVNPTLSTWVSGGAGASGSVGENVDILEDFKITQFFQIGNEDLEVDITRIISSSITNQIENHGLMISYDVNHEEDQKTYFVKRFASKEAYDISKHPFVSMEFDDTIADELKNITFNNSVKTFLYNNKPGSFNYINLMSGSSEVSGSNCLKFILEIDHDFITGSFEFSGSQFQQNGIFKPGIYVSDFVLNEDSNLNKIIESTGSVRFLPKWTSNDSSITYKSLDVITFERNSFINIEDVIFNLNNKSNYYSDEIVKIYLDVFKLNSSLKLVKLPREDSGIIISGLKYSIRDIQNNFVIIDFSSGTKLSNDFSRHYFMLDMSNLIPSRSYVVDLSYEDEIHKRIFRNISNSFTVLKR